MFLKFHCVARKCCIEGEKPVLIGFYVLCMQQLLLVSIITDLIGSLILFLIQLEGEMITYKVYVRKLAEPVKPIVQVCFKILQRSVNMCGSHVGRARRSIGTRFSYSMQHASAAE